MDIYNVDNNDTLMTTQTNDDAIPSCDNDEDLYTKMTSFQGLESSLADKGAILGHSDLEDPFILSEKSPCDLIVRSIAPMENLSLCASPLYHDIYTADSSNASNIPPQGTEMRDSDHVDKSPRRSPGRAKCLSPNKMSALLPTYTNAATRSSMIPNPPFIFAPFRERKILDDKGHSLMFPPNMIKVGALKVMTEIDMPAKLKINQSIPTTLPSELLMPKKLRCVFCQKFDSVCSSCHFKWRTIQDSRKTVLMKNIGSMPFLKRVGIFFATILVGNADFLECLLKEHKGTRSWCASVRVVPLKPKISNNVKKLLKSGRIFALHLACAFDCIESAKILLNAGIPYRNSETRHFPADFLPFPVTQEWNDVFQKSSQYREVVMSERAREFRKAGNYEAAKLEYAHLMEMNPMNENSHCGVAKMLFDQGKFEECIARCDILLEKQDEIHWIEFGPKAIIDLRSKATDQFHKQCHATEGPALKMCGCVSTINTVLSIRKLKFSILKHVLSYCDCVSLWSLWRATSIKLLQNEAAKQGAALCDDSIGLMLSHEYGYAEMYESVKNDRPNCQASYPIIANPIKFLGLRVTAMADFDTFIICSSVAGSNPRHKERNSSVFFRKQRESWERFAKIVVTKEFRVNREGVGKVWNIHVIGEWEYNEEATIALDDGVYKRLANDSCK